MEIQKQGDKLVGYMYNPHRNGIGVDSTAFTGIKLPAPPPAPDLTKLKFGTPITLFNGKDLTGWRLINEKQKNGFSVVNGLLTNNPVQVEGAPHVSYGNLRTDQEFEDFNLKLEVNVPEGVTVAFTCAACTKFRSLIPTRRLLTHTIWEPFIVALHYCQRGKARRNLADDGYYPV